MATIENSELDLLNTYDVTINDKKDLDLLKDFYFNQRYESGCLYRVKNNLKEKNIFACEGQFTVFDNVKPLGKIGEIYHFFQNHPQFNPQRYYNNYFRKIYLRNNENFKKLLKSKKIQKDSFTGLDNISIAYNWSWPTKQFSEKQLNEILEDRKEALISSYYSKIDVISYLEPTSNFYILDLFNCSQRENIKQNLYYAKKL